MEGLIFGILKYLIKSFVCVVFLLFPASWETKTLKLAKMAFIGQETITKRHRHNSLWGMYALTPVSFTDLTINSQTKPYNLASSRAVVSLGPLWSESLKSLKCPAIAPHSLGRGGGGRCWAFRWLVHYVQDCSHFSLNPQPFSPLKKTYD